MRPSSVDVVTVPPEVSTTLPSRRHVTADEPPATVRLPSTAMGAREPSAGTKSGVAVDEARGTREPSARTRVTAPEAACWNRVPSAYVAVREPSVPCTTISPEVYVVVSPISSVLAAMVSTVRSGRRTVRTCALPLPSDDTLQPWSRRTNVGSDSSPNSSTKLLQVRVSPSGKRHDCAPLAYRRREAPLGGQTRPRAVRPLAPGDAAVRGGQHHGASAIRMQRTIGGVGHHAALREGLHRQGALRVPWRQRTVHERIQEAAEAPVGAVLPAAVAQRHAQGAVIQAKRRQQIRAGATCDHGPPHPHPGPVGQGSSEWPRPRPRGDLGTHQVRPHLRHVL